MKEFFKGLWAVTQGVVMAGAVVVGIIWHVLAFTWMGLEALFKFSSKKLEENAERREEERIKLTAGFAATVFHESPEFNALLPEHQKAVFEELEQHPIKTLSLSEIKSLRNGLVTQDKSQNDWKEGILALTKPYLEKEKAWAEAQRESLQSFLGQEAELLSLFGVEMTRLLQANFGAEFVPAFSFAKNAQKIEVNAHHAGEGVFLTKAETELGTQFDSLVQRHAEALSNTAQVIRQAKENLPALVK